MKWVKASHLVDGVIHVSDSGEGKFHKSVIPIQEREAINPLIKRVNDNFDYDFKTMKYEGTFVEHTVFEELVGSNDWGIFCPVQTKAWANIIKPYNSKFRNPMEFLEFTNKPLDVLYILDKDPAKIYATCVLHGDIPRAARVSIQRRLKKALEFMNYIDIEEVMQIVCSTNNVDVFLSKRGVIVCN